MHSHSFEFTADDGVQVGLSPSVTRERLFALIQKSLRIECHCDLYHWLQGDVQELFPHPMLIAAWGEFGLGAIQHDVISRLTGMKTFHVDARGLNPVTIALFREWLEGGCRPLTTNYPIGALVDSMPAHASKADALGALQHIGSALVHGIRDRRGGHDSLYIAMSIGRTISQCQHEIFEYVVPFLDAALRRTALEPAQLHADGARAIDATADAALSSRELEIMNWVSKGKTNPEIAVILDISAFTVKNHLQRIFRKLDVSNRVQAVALFERITNSLPPT
jgi:transcriptional regulator EpsA